MDRARSCWGPQVAYQRIFPAAGATPLVDRIFKLLFPRLLVQLLSSHRIYIILPTGCFLCKNNGPCVFPCMNQNTNGHIGGGGGAYYSYLYYLVITGMKYAMHP
jgi:hypothetical protein